MTGAPLGKGEPAVSAALAGGASYADAAKAGEVSYYTVSRRMADPEYAARVLALRAELLQRAIGNLARVSEAAALCLEELLSEDNPPQTRLGACRAVFEYAGRFHDVAVLEQRIAALEAERDAAKPGAPRGLRVCAEDRTADWKG